MDSQHLVPSTLLAPSHLGLNRLIMQTILLTIRDRYKVAFDLPNLYLQKLFMSGQRCVGYICTQNVFHYRFELKTSVELQTTCSATWQSYYIKVLCTKCHTVIRYTHESNFVDAHQQSTAFPQPLSATLTNSPRHYAQNPDTKFHPNRTINVEITGINSFTPVSE
jgi:hypothetical protein